VPSQSMPQVEDVHMALCHALAVSLGDRIAQPQARRMELTLELSHERTRR
jgi:hypothetical protein